LGRPPCHAATIISGNETGVASALGTPHSECRRADLSSADNADFNFCVELGSAVESPCCSSCRKKVTADFQSAGVESRRRNTTKCESVKLMAKPTRIDINFASNTGTKQDKTTSDAVLEIMPAIPDAVKLA